MSDKKKKIKIINIVIRYSITISLLVFVSCHKKKNNFLYYKTGEKFREMKIDKNGDTTLYYFYKSGIKKGESKLFNDTEHRVYRTPTGKISEKGYYQNNKRIGWHNFYDSIERKKTDIYFVYNKENQIINYQSNGFIDKRNSLYTELELLKDTFKINEDIYGYVRYHNPKSTYNNVFLLLGKDINSSFSNLTHSITDTLRGSPKEKDIYFKLKINKKGVNFIRGYILDFSEVNKETDTLNYTKRKAIKVFFEKKIYIL